MPQNASIRSFAWSDLDDWTALVNALDGTGDAGSEVSAAYKRLFLSQPSLHPEENCFIAEVDGEGAGMARVSPEPAIGRAVAEIAVLPIHRRRGVGRQLLDTVMERTSDLGLSTLHIQVSVHSRGGRFLLEDSGFYAVRRYWRLCAGLDGVEGPEPPPAFSIRPFELGRDEAALTELQNEAFCESWGFSPNTVQEIAARVRLRSWEPEGILLLQDGGRLCGYNWTHRPAERGAQGGIIGMTGVHPDYRRRGLGRIMVSAGMSYLREMGAEEVRLEVDHSNKPARELYLSLGFDLAEETVWYELNLGAQEPGESPGSGLDPGS